jgi:chromosomal replication initiation ATPase DnaA
MLVQQAHSCGAQKLFYPVGEVDRFATRRFIEATVAAAFDLPVDELAARTRRQAPVAFARQLSMYCAHIVLGLSLTEAGLLFNRDRTRAAHACRVVEDRRDDPAIDEMITSIEAIIQSWAEAVSGLKRRKGDRR